MHRKTVILIQIIFLMVLLLLSGCSGRLPSVGEKHPYKRDVTLTRTGVDDLAALAKKVKKNRELDSEPLVYSNGGMKIGAAFSFFGCSVCPVCRRSLCF